MADPLISTEGGVAGVDQAHQPLREIPAAMAQALLLLGRPAFISDGFTRQIDDGINVIEVVMALKSRHRVTRGSRRARAVSGCRVETVTLCPSSSNLGIRCRPIRPVPPVQDLHTTSLTWLATPAHGHGHRVGIAQR